MRQVMRTMGLASVLAIGAFVLVEASADAGCGGGGRVRGGYGGGHSFGVAHGARASCCGTRGTSTGGMMMPMSQGASASMQGSYQGAAAPAAASYACPMHPGVVSSTPASCPYCGMALTRR